MIKEQSNEDSSKNSAFNDGDCDSSFTISQKTSVVSPNPVPFTYNTPSIVPEKNVPQQQPLGLNHEELHELIDDDEDGEEENQEQTPQQNPELKHQFDLLSNQNSTMQGILELYSGLYLVHRAQQYKFVATTDLEKSYGNYDIRKFDQVNPEYQDQLLDSNFDINKEQLQKMLNAFIGIESFQILSNVEKIPPKNSDGYFLEITISLKFHGQARLHYIKYGGKSKNYNVEVHKQMIRDDPCMVLLKETLPEVYHGILFKLIKRNLINKNKVTSVSTSASSHGDGKVLTSSSLVQPPFIKPVQETTLNRIENPVSNINQSMPPSGNMLASGGFMNQTTNNAPSNPSLAFANYQRESTQKMVPEQAKSVVSLDNRSTYSWEKPPVVQTLSTVPDGAPLTVETSKIRKTFKHVNSEFPNCTINKVDYWKDIKNYKIKIDDFVQMKKKREFIKQANDYIQQKNWPSLLNLLIQKVYLVAMDLQPKNFKTIHFCL